MRHGAACLLILSVWGAVSSSVQASSIEDVRQASEAMHAWLGDDDNAQRWREFLRSERLEAQLEKGAEANPAEVISVLARYRGDTAGLQTPQFAAVREALEGWLEELSSSRSASLADWVSAQSVEFAPITDEDVTGAREQVLAAAQELEDFLSLGTADNKQAWLKFLQWDALQEQLAADQIDTDLLYGILEKYYDGFPGLEVRQFVNLRESLMRFRRLALAQSDEEIESKHLGYLTDLTKALADPSATAQIPVRLSWLEHLGQSPKVVQRVREGFGSPNVYFSVSSETIAEGLANKVDEESSVREVILGTRITGVAQTVADVTARLVPREDQAAIEIEMSGQSFTNTVGRQSPVRIYSRGVAQVLGRKRLYVDTDGIRGEQATADCTVDNDIYSIRADGRLASGLIQRVAWNRAREQQAAAERISAQRAERRVRRLMDARANELIRKGNRRLDNEVRMPLRQRNIYPRWVRFWSTARRLNLRALQARRNQLAASSRPPAVPDHGINLQLHESAIVNSASNAVGGLLITDERAEELVKELTGEVPEELEVKQDDDPWSITFDRTSPLTVSFRDDLVMIAIRGRKFTRGEEAVEQVMQIAATYAIEPVEGRIQMTRQGDIEVTYPGKKEGDRLSFTELRNKTFMTGKFSGLFKQEIRGEGLNLPERWKNLEKLSLEFTLSNYGWLSLGWN